MGTRVFVGGLTYRVRERDIEKFFRKYGRIKEVAMKNGFAFVEFDDYRDADDAVYELNGKELLGERVSVERARGTPRGADQWRGSGRGYGPPRGRNRDNRDSDVRHNDRYGPPTRTEYRLIVENLSTRVSWQSELPFPWSMWYLGSINAQSSMWFAHTFEWQSHMSISAIPLVPCGSQAWCGAGS
ncbi:serine-arginine protein 55 isoform X2 [Agrilus planipennis]|uniref:Serine-arginine protein 55 isoform X2 n=1 Tax=Agrilus planipennis TaxID=224129 RepID=A0A1W4XD85_AGRPL|nr:serine-arginine protein 55 isoform X2 [Agrilus planipennis]